MIHLLIFMVPAGNSDILYNKPIDLFVNMVSFGEMTIDSIDKYFSIVKSSVNGAYLYCCNRMYKKLEGGEITRFSDYPWGGEINILVDEECPWHKHFYTTRSFRFLPIPQIFRPYDGQIWHRLVQYAPNVP
jgi:hypothetical protein